MPGIPYVIHAHFQQPLICIKIRSMIKVFLKVIEISNNSFRKWFFPIFHYFLSPILTGGHSQALHPTFFKVAKNWMFRPYMILKRKIELFTRKILMYVPFRWDLPFFCYLVPIFFHSHTSKRLFFTVLWDTQNSPKRDTMKTKNVDLGILIYMHCFKIWKNKKIHFLIFLGTLRFFQKIIKFFKFIKALQTLQKLLHFIEFLKILRLFQKLY